MLNRRTVRKIRVRFSSPLRIEMHNAVIRTKYGLRGKSKWLANAIKQFVLCKNYVDLVEHGDSINQAELSEVEAFYLNDEVLEMMKNALINVRAKYPLFEGVQSAFIRACVINGLLQNENFPGEISFITS